MGTLTLATSTSVPRLFCLSSFLPSSTSTSWQHEKNLFGLQSYKLTRSRSDTIGSLLLEKHECPRSFLQGTALNSTIGIMSILLFFSRPQLLILLRGHARAFLNPTTCLRHAPVSHSMDTPDTEDFFRYTSGRWLWNEAARLDEGYKRFNIAELKRAAAKAIGAHSCSRMTKLAEGGFKKVFKLVMDNNYVVIARIPNPNIGRADRVIASEVATMEFVRSYDSPRDDTTLTRIRQAKSSASRFRMFCLGAETNRMFSSPLTSSWSMPEAQSLATCGKVWKSARRWLSLTKRSRLRGSFLQSHSNGEETIPLYVLICLLTLFLVSRR